MRYLLALLLIGPVQADEPPMTMSEAQEMFKAYQQMQLERVLIEEYANKLEKHIQVLQNATNCV